MKVLGYHPLTSEVPAGRNANILMLSGSQPSGDSLRYSLGCKGRGKGQVEEDSLGVASFHGHRTTL